MSKYGTKSCRDCDNEFTYKDFEQFFSISSHFNLPDVCPYCYRKTAMSCFYCGRIPTQMYDLFPLQLSDKLICKGCTTKRPQVLNNLDSVFEPAKSADTKDPPPNLVTQIFWIPDDDV